MQRSQPVDFSFDDGSRAVELARDAIESYILHGQREHLGSMRDAFYRRTGAFVRIESTQGLGRLRGCAGVYDGTDQLGPTIVDAAIDAASEDSCGSEIEPAELTAIRVSVCLVGTIIPTADPLDDLTIGTHGLVIESPTANGWMYPTVPAENHWQPHEYLDRTCRKTGLGPTDWERDDVSVTLFEGTVFRERAPGGSVERV